MPKVHLHRERLILLVYIECFHDDVGILCLFVFEFFAVSDCFFIHEVVVALTAECQWLVCKGDHIADISTSVMGQGRASVGFL